MPKLFDLPHAQARAALETGAPVYLLINPVEYHGPHLSLHNDRLCSLGVVRELHDDLVKKHPDWPLLEADDLEIGVEPTPGIGSRITPFPVAVGMIKEACRAIAELGAKRVVLMTFHGQPLHNMAIEAGVELLRAQGVAAVAPFNLLTREMLRSDGGPYAGAFAGIEDEAERKTMIQNLPQDFHAGFFETSVAMHYAPESVSVEICKNLPPCPEIKPIPTFSRLARIARLTGASGFAQELELMAFGLGWHALRPFPGYTGRPHHATPEAGAFFAKHIRERVLEHVEEVFAGRAKSAEPIMRWTAKLSLGGRLSPVPTAH